MKNKKQYFKLVLINPETIHKKSELINELEKGEKSRFIKHFDRKKFLKMLHQKYSAE